MSTVPTAIPTPLPQRRGGMRNGNPPTSGALWGFAHRYRWRILLTYGLFVIENLLRLAQPLLIGWAINDLLHSSFVGLGIFALGQAAHMGIRVGRQMYDTRAFTAIYSEKAGELVLGQRDDHVDVSVVAARSALARDFVEFFERQVPIVIQSLFSLVGAVLFLFYYDRVLVLYCAALVVPAMVLNFFFGRKSLRLSGLLHDQLEREVEVIRHPTREAVDEHYHTVARWRIKLSDNEALTMGLMETFVLLLMMAALVRFCTQPGAEPGDIFAVFRYVLLFIMALDRVPMLVNQFSRLRDIGTRMTKAK
jgi:ABC-type multidrug transport system fused ATPase/permease subunit